MKIYHNTRCSKSRKTLDIIKQNTSEYEVIEYLKKGLTYHEVRDLLSLLRVNPREIVRLNDPIWINLYSKKEMNDNDIINAIVKNPKIIERPIVTYKKRAIIGRPPENVLLFFNQEGIS